MQRIRESIYCQFGMVFHVWRHPWSAATSAGNICSIQRRPHSPQIVRRCIATYYPLMHSLTPLSDDYRAVMRLSDALMSAIRDITGEEPNLSKVSKTWYPG